MATDEDSSLKDLITQTLDEKGILPKIRVSSFLSVPEAPNIEANLLPLPLLLF